jgi:hypothetical protein
MELIVKKLYDIQSFSTINVESVSEELVMINLELKPDSINFDSRPLHCRYDFGDFPPLDISFDSETGLLKEITLFVSKSYLKNENEIGDVEYQKVIGYPCMNTEFMVKNEFYYDEICEIIITRRELSLSVGRANRKSSKKVIVNENLSILLDESEVVTGVEFSNLSKDNLNLIS